MKEQPNDLWRGGPWEQPSPSFPTPPPVVVPARRPPVLRVRRRRRALLPFLALFLLVVGLSLGTVAVRWLLPWEEEPLTPYLSKQEERDPFAALERAETGTGVQVQISQREGEAMDAVEIYEKCVPSVVSIQADGEEEYSTGTGVVMSQDGYILTNAHVVADSLRMSVLLSDGRVMEARLVGADAGEDLAVLKVEASGLTPAEFGDSDRLRCGEMVVAIGDPLGYRTSITQGIISALNRTVPVDGVELQVIQTSAPINFGNSGGALINDRGQVVGITTLKVMAQDSTVEGLGFAIPIQKVKEVADWLIAGRPAMGFTVDFSGGSLRVAALEENSSAGHAGLQVDDVLLALDGTPLPTIQELRQVKNTLVPGESATLTVRRGGEERSISFSVQCEDDFPERAA